MSERPILYSFRRCPYAMRARLALAVSGQICELREVKLANKPSEMIEASAKATVPVLVLPDGDVKDESLDIMYWALNRCDPGGWLTRDLPELVETNDGPFKHHLDRYKYAPRHDNDPIAHRSACLGLLRPLDTRLAATPHLAGDAMGIVDAAIMPFVRQFAFTDRDWFDSAPIPAVRRWLDHHISSQLFRSIMEKRVPWVAGGPVSVFPKA
ncbi:glutathione S-transferase [Altererythrobacter aquiaggeris]|uniref:glutathione S-transferase n=1 Tax=Aestuarierythrobacter aquiaggeris TaxID=1898396 RepID=UPI0030159ABD